MRLENKWLRGLTHNAGNTHMYIIDTSSSRVLQSILICKLQYEAVYSSSEFPRGPYSSVGRGGRDVRCSAACWLIMGRELQLGWPGRVLEPVGLAQGGLATDPGGDGMKSGTSQNTSPGFGAFLAFPPPMAACPCVYMCGCVWDGEQGKEMCEGCNACACSQGHVCMFYIRAVWTVHPCSEARQHRCRTHPGERYQDIWAESERGS